MSAYKGHLHATKIDGFVPPIVHTPFGAADGYMLAFLMVVTWPSYSIFIYIMLI
jgi:hypothetical protein